MRHKFYAEPVSPERRTWVVYVVGEGVIIDGIRADDAQAAIRKAKTKIKKIGYEIWDEEK